ncbi:MAG: MBL fold metallo-hydrolase [bacterium]
MQIKTLIVGPIQTNCYLVIDEKTKNAVVIDPGDDPKIILPELAGLFVSYIIVTHAHWDHVGAIEAIQQATKAPILNDLAEGELIKFGEITLKVIRTPGHTADGICLYTPGHLFAGDTLFWGTHGRVDLPGSDPRDMVRSLRRLAELPDETIVYPGHDRTTTIKAEKESGILG